MALGERDDALLPVNHQGVVPNPGLIGVRLITQRAEMLQNDRCEPQCGNDHFSPGSHLRIQLDVQMPVVSVTM